MTMYFFVMEVVPAPKSKASPKYAGAHVSCWIVAKNQHDAKSRATALIADSGWLIGKVIEEKEVSADNYAADDKALNYYEQALVDNEVCVFYTFPVGR